VPLTRQTVTAASRVMLPVYPILAAWMGVAYLFGGPARTSGASYTAAKSWLPIPTWGAMFIVLAVLLLIGYAQRSRPMVAFALTVTAAAYTVWAACFVWSLFTVTDASLVAPAWPLFVAVACFASATSVIRSEGDHE
jgi:hypothetical protein